MTNYLERLLKAKSIDEIDPISKNALDETTGKPTNKEVRRRCL